MVHLGGWLIPSLVTIHLHTTGVGADGTGLIGYGKTLYNPTCTFACRNVIRKQTLACTPSSSTENHGTAHNPVTTPPKCFVEDHVFLKTMALCIDTYCPLTDNPSNALVEDYWASHLGTGTLGNYKYVPVLSYYDALAFAREDESNVTAGNSTESASEEVPEGLVPHEVSSPLPITTGGSKALNKTSLVSPVQWQLQYNYLSDFEINEKGHSTMTITVAIIAILLPVLLSLFRFIPGAPSNRAMSYLKSKMIYPATFGGHHRQPTAAGLVPTRGQSLYIFLISFLNIILLLAPYTIKQPQASFTTLQKQTISIIGNRAGVMAMGNVVAIFVLSARNSPLLYLTDWSYSTYLLLHRWLGYWVVIHTVIHSAMLWAYYVLAGSYSDEILRLYWQWGIVGTVAVCALFPLSILQVRQKLYEFFIVSHVVLSLLFLIGYYYHIWYVYTYNWGYEIWMFVAAGIWALERLARLIRMAFQGSRTALVSVIPDTDGEYLRIDVQGKDLKDGVAYLCFPSLTWRFWETHPFSVCGSLPDLQQSHVHSHHSSPASISDSKGEPDSTHEQPDIEKTSPSTPPSDTPTQPSIPTTTFYARVRTGITQTLAKKASANPHLQTRLRILIEGPYSHSGHIPSQIVPCTTTLFIAGGVGITAVLPLLHRLSGSTSTQQREIKLLFSSRKNGLVENLAPVLNSLPENVHVETLVGRRFDLEGVLYREIVSGREAQGPVAIVVSGPPEMADEVRRAVTRIGGTERGRAVVLVDEAFSW